MGAFSGFARLKRVFSRTHLVLQKAAKHIALMSSYSIRISPNSVQPDPKLILFNQFKIYNYNEPSISR